MIIPLFTFYVRAHLLLYTGLARHRSSSSRYLPNLVSCSILGFGLSHDSNSCWSHSPLLKLSSVSSIIYMLSFNNKQFIKIIQSTWTFEHCLLKLLKSHSRARQYDTIPYIYPSIRCCVLWRIILAVFIPYGGGNYAHGHIKLADM